MTSADLKALLQAEKANALSGQNESDLSAERSRAMDYYLGDMEEDMPAPDGRSKAISSDVADVVEGLMPPLMEIFAGGDQVVEFAPVGPEDEEAAQQETDFVNHVFMQKNLGFLVMYSFVKDALLQKNGLVKVYWQKSENEERETYTSKGEDEFALIMQQVQGGELELIEHSPNEDGTHDFTVRKRKSYGCAKVDPVPPEEFGIAKNAKALRLGECTYCYHETETNEAKLIEDGFDPVQVRSLPGSEVQSGSEELARDTVEEGNLESSGDTTNRATRSIKVTEHYVLMSYKDDEPARLYQVTTGGGQGDILKRANGELAIDPIDDFPIRSMTPIIQTHRFFGRSIADLVMDIQRIKTALLRALLDNAYLANNQRLEVAEEHAGPRTLDDLLTNRIGGFVRVKRPGGIVPIQNQSIGNFAFPLIEYIDGTRDNRTGVTKQAQGLDASSLQNETATKTNALFQAAQARVKLIARIFAETGIRDMFSLLHQVIRKNEKQAQTVKLRNKWVPVDPRAWKTRSDMTINVGLGTGTKDQQVAHLLNLLGVQKEALAIGVATPKNIYETAKRLPELLSFKNSETFFTDPTAPDDPANPKPQPQPDPKIMQIQMQAQLDEKADARKAQIEEVQAQADIATNQQKIQAEMVQSDREYQLKERLELIKAQLEREKFDREEARKEREFELNMAFKREQHEQALQSGAFKMAAGQEAHSQKMEQNEARSE